MLRITLALFLLVCGFEPVAAQDHIAIRQTLLFEQLQRTQRIGKSACMVMSGADSQLHSDATVDNAVAFNLVMAAIIDGDPSIGLVPMAAGPERAALSEVAKVSRGLTQSAQQVAAGDIHAVPVALILSRPAMIAEGMHAALSEMGPSAGGQSAAVQNAVRLLHQQNALLEEILKDFCHMRLSIGAKDTAAQITQNMALFTSINAALIKGDAALGLHKAPNIKIKITLGQIDSKWVSFERLLKPALAGGDMELRDAQLASVIGGTLSKRLTKLVSMYQAL